MMWQTKLGRCIYTSPSGYKVYQNLGYRWLTLGSTALQTVVNRRKPQIPVLHYLPALSLMARTFPNDCCLLGLGGAGIVHMLASNTSTHSIIAVDSSEEVIDIAQKFFSLDRTPNVTIIHQNALDYVKGVMGNFFHLLIDLYDANHFPVDCSTNDFFMNCKKSLRNDGFLAINLANYKEQWPIFQFIRKHFKTTLVVPIRKSANMVIIASKNENQDAFLNKLVETGEIKKIIYVEPWGYVGEY